MLNSRVRSERYRVAWPVWRVLTWVFSRGLRALFVLRQMESQNRTGNASSLADRVQPDRIFAINRGSPTISKPENGGVPFKRI